MPMHVQCYLVQLGNDLLIVLGCGCQLCQVNLLLPLLLILYLQGQLRGAQRSFC